MTMSSIASTPRATEGIRTGLMPPTGPIGRAEQRRTAASQPTSHQTIERSMRILEYLWSRQAPVRLTRISHALGMDRSTVLRILQTLERLGYIHRNEETKAYALGYMSLRLGSRNRLMSTNAWHAEPFLKRLAAETGEIATLGSLEGVSVIFHRCIASPDAPPVPLEVGAAYDAHATATGRMLLANLSCEELRRLYRCQRLRQYTRHTNVCFETLLKQLQTCWEQGYAFESEELIPGYGSIAVPIVNPRGVTNVAIGVVAAARSLTPTRRAWLIERCMSIAKEIYAHVIR
ncbi:MAG TPA: IclR family transcriptional regulator [Steroidobacteraceae bacterium]|jgi:DNA-binding IclR family transcriptional regulator